MSGNSYQWNKDQLGNDGMLDRVAFNTYRGYYGFTHTDFAGYDCSKMECPRGDDHLTPGVNEVQVSHHEDEAQGGAKRRAGSSVFDVTMWLSLASAPLNVTCTILTRQLQSSCDSLRSSQRVRCSATAGGFMLTFRENTTELINWNDPAPIVEKKLEKIFTIGNVTVTFTNETAVAYSGGHGSAKGVCNTTYADIEFLTELGDLPLMTLTSSNLVKKIGMSDLAGVPKINVTEFVKGTRENIECSGHGYCNPDIGMCICDVGYASSDGQGGIGHRGDCGFHYEETQIFLPVDELEE